MTFSQRAAALAAMSLCVAGIAGVSTPGFASEMDRTSVSTPSTVSLKPINDPASTAVPAPSPSTGQTPEVPGVTVQDLSAADPTPDADSDEFASLTEAVAAQDMPETANGDLACLAGAIYFESKGEPLSGQLAVADVIINRSKSGRFPSSICSVVKQPGQFSFVRHGSIPSIDTGRKTYRTAMAVAQIALAKAWDSPVPKALFFHAKRVSPGWGLTKVAAIGHHVFYR